MSAISGARDRDDSVAEARGAACAPPTASEGPSADPIADGPVAARLGRAVEADCAVASGAPEGVSGRLFALVMAILPAPVALKSSPRQWLPAPANAATTDNALSHLSRIVDDHALRPVAVAVVVV